MKRLLRIGTRGSAMALRQTENLIQLLKTLDPELQTETTIIRTVGDRTAGDLSKLGGKGAFVTDIEQALLDQSIDCSIFCMKDMPGDRDFMQGLSLAAYLPREDVRDVMVCRVGETMMDLAVGSKIGTSSPRRAALLQNFYPHCSVVWFRGNVDSRLRRLDAGEVDALILSYAGLQRLGLEHRASYIHDPDEFCPAVGQGALGIQCRKDDEWNDFFQQLDDAPSRFALTVERAMLYRLQGNCFTPMGGWCRAVADSPSQQNWRLDGFVASADGKNMLAATNFFDYSIKPEEAGIALAEELLQEGAQKILQAC
ncbi:MAG: hydroxymethylbilane synthase [Alphaproteobacteria bacterium]